MRSARLSHTAGSRPDRDIEWFGPLSVAVPAAISARLLLQIVGPNPSGNVIDMAYERSVAGHTRLAILDVAGRRVVMLIDRDDAAGRFEVEWPGRNGQGQPVRSGAYFLRFEAEGKVLSQRAFIAR